MKFTYWMFETIGTRFKFRCEILDTTATGYGNTSKEAIQNAKANLLASPMMKDRKWGTLTIRVPK